MHRIEYSPDSEYADILDADQEKKNITYHLKIKHSQITQTYAQVVKHHTNFQ